MKPSVTLILPAYNEAKRIGNAVAKARRALAKMRVPFEIIIAEDGSSDGTKEIAGKLARGRVRLLSAGKRLGRGGALDNAIRKARGAIVAYVDLATDVAHVPELIAEVEKGAAVATGSRYADRAKSKRGALRGFISGGYNGLVRLFFFSKLSDHQCGFKAFDRKKVLPLLEKVGDRHWFWDTELLLRAQREGMRVSEIPVEWAERRETKVRLLKDSLYMAGKLAELKLEFLKNK